MFQIRKMARLNRFWLTVLRRILSFGLELNSRAGQLGHSVPEDPQPLRRFFEAVLCRR